MALAPWSKGLPTLHAAENSTRLSRGSADTPLLQAGPGVLGLRAPAWGVLCATTHHSPRRQPAFLPCVIAARPTPLCTAEDTAGDISARTAVSVTSATRNWRCSKRRCGRARGCGSTVSLRGAVPWPLALLRQVGLSSRCKIWRDTLLPRGLRPGPSLPGPTGVRGCSGFPLHPAFPRQDAGTSCCPH